jgi:hypothetical protein
MGNPFFARLLNRFASLLMESDSLQSLKTGQERLRVELAAVPAPHKSFTNDFKPPFEDIPADRIQWPKSVDGDPTRTVIGSEGAIYSL